MTLTMADQIELRILIAARPSSVFRFLSQPDAFKLWMGTTAEIDPTPGGAVRVSYPNGDVGIGRVEEIVMDRRLAMSWGYEGGTHGIAPGTTRVEFLLEPADGGTRLTLWHSGLTAAAQRANHRMGWRYALGNLSAATTGELARDPDRLIDDYVAAWSTTEETSRVALLERCMTGDAVFRDGMGYAEGVQSLNEHIAGVQRFTAGLVLERSGPVTRSHDFLSFPWRVVASSGAAVMTGTNTAQVGVDGKIRSMIGFSG